MPNFYTHYLVAARTLAALDGDLRQRLDAQRRAYNLGAQGPDIFFYHRAWPWTRSGGVNRFGHLLHTQKVGDFFGAALVYARAQTGAERSTVEAYLCGYASHYALDTNAHPYIIYRTGDVDAPGEEGRRTSLAHTRLEILIDVLLLQRETGRDLAWLRAQNLLQHEEGESKAIARLYAAVLPEVYGRPVAAREVETAISDMEQITAIMLERSNVLTQLFVGLLARADRSRWVRTVLFPSRVHEGHDILNLANSPWFLPWDGAIPRTESVPDMMARAVQDGRRYGAAAGAAVWDGAADNVEQAQAVLGARSFFTGIDCRQPLHMRHFDLARFE